MSISLFKTLIAISETGSFSGASQKVFVTHAAVGQQMRRLEELLSVDLFDRTEKTPRLNQLGNALIPKAKAIVFSYETILDDLIGDPQMIGELTLGAVPSTIRGLIPIAVKRLVNTYPDLHIKVVPGISSKLLDQVESGTLDAAVISEPKRIPTNFNWMPIIKEELKLLTAPEIIEKDPIKILTSEPYIRHTRQAAVGQLADEWLSINNVIVKDCMEMESLENISSMVAHNLGVSIVPNICVPDDLFQSLQKISLGNNSIYRSLGIVTQSDCSKIKLVQRLYEQLYQTSLKDIS